MSCPFNNIKGHGVVSHSEMRDPLYDTQRQINLFVNRTPKFIMEKARPSGHTHAGKTIALSFVADELRLHGTLHLPDCARPHLIVGSHGLYSSGESPKQAELARRCCRMGLAYFRFDHRGCGRSQGHFETVTSLGGRRSDLLHAVAYLRSKYELGDRLGLFGSSLGGATCLAAAAALQPQRLVTLAAPADSRSILSAAENHTAPVEPLFLNDAFQFDLREAIRPVSGLLLIHGDRDEVIPAAHAEMIFSRVRDPKKRLIIPGGDHRLSRREHQQRFLEETLDWFKPLTERAPADR